MPVPFDGTITEEEKRIINRLLCQSAGIEYHEGDFESNLDSPLPDNVMAIDEYEEDDYCPTWNASDYICEFKERHRRALKLGEIPYQVAWMDGFTHKKNSKITYKVGSRMRKAFEAGKRARNV